jgi:PAS domain S-box-containing protein
MKKAGNDSNAKSHQKKVDNSLIKKISTDGKQISETDILKLLHELEVHQIELKMQNEELMASKEKSEQSKEKYISLYDISPTGFFTITKEGEIIDVNLSGANMLCIDRYKLENIKFGFFVSDDSKQVFNNFLEKVFKSKETETCEVIFSTNGSLPLYKFITGVISENEEHCHLNVIDITQSKLVDALKESEDRYRSLFFMAGEGITIMTNEGKLVEVNQSFAKMHGYTVKEMIKMDLNDLVTTESANLIQKRLKRILEGKNLTFEVDHLHKDGHIINLEVSVCLITQGDKSFIQSFHRDITERKLAEEKIRISELKYRMLIESSTEIIFCVNNKGEFQFTNHIFAKTFNQTPDYFIGKSLWDIYSVQDANNLQVIISSVFETGESLMYESEAPISDKTLCYLSNANPIEDESGKVTLVLVNSTNITERKQTEMKLRESMELLSMFIKHSPIYAFIKDVTQNESRVLMASENYLDMIGIPGSAMIGRTMHELFPLKIADKFLADDWSVVSKNEIMKLEEHLNDRIYTTFKFPIIQKERTLLAGYTIDITERKKAEKAIHESLIKWKTTFDGIKDSIFLIDSNNIILEVNNSALEFIGKPKDEIIGFHCWQHVHNTSEPIDNCPFIRSKNSKLRESMEMQLYDKWLEVNVHPLLDKDDQFLGGVHIINDITDRKLAEQALKDSEFKFRNIADFTYDWEYWEAEDKSIIYMNPACERISGYLPYEFIANPELLFAIVHEDDLALYKEHFDKIHSKEYCDISEVILFRVINKDFSVTYIEHVCTPVLDELENYFGRRVSNRDITERKWAEDALKESEMKYRTLADYTYDWEYWENEDLSIIYMSPSCERITGFKPDEFTLSPKLLMAIVHEDDLLSYTEHHERMHSVEHRDFSEVIVYRIFNKNKSLTYIEHICTPVYNENGVYFGRRVNNRDITERRKAELELIKAKEQKEIILKKEITEKEHLLKIQADSLNMSDAYLYKVKNILEQGKALNEKNVDISLKNKQDWLMLEQEFYTINPMFMKKLSSKFTTLTNTEIRVCAMIKLNMRSKEIANILNISQKTVDNHRQNIRKKLDLDDHTQLSVFLMNY